MIDRRTLLKSLVAGVGATLWSVRRSDAALPKAKITRVKCWAHPSMNRSFNQSALLVTVETDIGITGIGEGGSPDLVRDLAGSVIGQNPFEIERLWQHMYMDTFYPPWAREDPWAGRDRSRAVGHQRQSLAGASRRSAARRQPELRRMLRDDLPARERPGSGRRYSAAGNRRNRSP